MSKPLNQLVRENRELRKSLGICRQCPNKLSERSKVYCEPHLRYYAQKSRGKYILKPCTSCGGIKETKKKLCNKCTYTIEQHKLHNCSKCGEDKTGGTSLYCRKCADIQNLKNKKRREKLFNLGKCIFCGCDKNPDRVNFKLCKSCQSKEQKKN